MLVALELAMVLESFGAKVLGPVGRADVARKLIIAEKADAAVLDAKLDGELSLPLARELADTGIPVVLLTGYVRSHLPEGYDDIPLLVKPVSPRSWLTPCAKRWLARRRPLRALSGGSRSAEY